MCCFSPCLLSRTHFTDGSFSQNRSCIKWSIGSWKQLGANMLTWRLWDPQLSSCCSHPLLTKTDTLSRRPPPLFLMLPPPHSQESQAEAVTVGPSAGNFLWTAGNNLTWGLDGVELSRARPNIQGRRLVPLSRLPREIPKSTPPRPPKM